MLDARTLPVSDREPLAHALFHAALVMRMAYAAEDPMHAFVHGERALHRIETLGQSRYAEMAKFLIGMNRWYLGDRTDTEQLLEVALTDNELGLLSSWRPFVLAWRHADRSELDEARAWAGRLIEAGRIRRLPLDEARGHWALAEVLRRAGELEAADTEIQAALTILRRTSTLDLPGALATLAAVRLAQGRAPEALAAAAEGLAIYEATGACAFFRGSFLRLIHARCLEAAGGLDAARTAIAAAHARLLAIAAKIGPPEDRESFLEGVPENRQTMALARQWLGTDPHL